MGKLQILLVILFIFFFILASFLGVIYLQKKAQNEELLKKNQTIVQDLQQKEDITTLEQVGTNWKDFNKLGKGPFANTNILTFASDGIVIRDFIEIKTKEGEILATSIVAFKGYYYDISSQKRSIVVPMVLKLSDGRLYHPAYVDVLSWNEEELEETILNKPKLFGATKGLVMKVGTYNHVPQEYLTNTKDQSIRFTILQLIDKYNQSWQTEVDKFYASGDPQIGIIFTSSYFDLAEQDIVTF